MPRRDGEQSIVDLLTASVKRRPSHGAVEEHGGSTLTYAWLDQMSGRVRDRLRRLGVVKGDRVGIYVRKSADAAPRWKTVGLNGHVDVTTGWRASECPFEATANEASAGIYFNPGSSDAAFELSDVALRNLTTGRDVTPGIAVLEGESTLSSAVVSR